MDIAGSYLKVSISPVVAFMYFQPAFTTMLCELASKYKKFIMKDGRMVGMLDKAPYGCIESAKPRYLYFEGTLEKLGFAPNSEEGCCVNC